MVKTIAPNVKLEDDKNNIYVVKDFLGRGGFGEVWKIESMKNKEPFAVKTFNPNNISDGVFNSLINEIEKGVQVKHDNVIEYFFVNNGETIPEFPPYIIMEFANQGTLKDLIDRKRQEKNFFSSEELLEICEQLIDGMEAVNEILVHRDIKPDNILIKNSIFKISDFGLAKLINEATRTHTFKGVGQIMYMAPEGWSGEKNTIQMDIYSMGIVFYELMSFSYPYTIKNPSDFDSWREAHFFQIPKKLIDINPNVDLTLSQVILRMMAKKVTDRYSNWAQIREDIKKIGERKGSKPNVLVAEIIKVRLEKDEKIKLEKLQKDTEERKILNSFKLANFQFENDIISFLKKEIDEFNKMYFGSKMSLYHEYLENAKEINSRIRLVSGEDIHIKLRHLTDKEFDIERTFTNDFGEKYRRKQLVRPKLYGRLILSWGQIYLKNGKGYNLLLVENEKDQYGSWFLLVNTNSAIVNRQRLPEPFPYGFEEIERELGNLNAMHIYITKVIEYDVKYILEMIKEHN